MPRKGYHSVPIPEGLYHKLEQYVDSSNGRYVTISEVVRKALREYFKNA